MRLKDRSGEVWFIDVDHSGACHFIVVGPPEDFGPLLLGLQPVLFLRSGNLTTLSEDVGRPWEEWQGLRRLA